MHQLCSYGEFFVSLLSLVKDGTYTLSLYIYIYTLYMRTFEVNWSCVFRLLSSFMESSELVADGQV